MAVKRQQLKAGRQPEGNERALLTLLRWESELKNARVQEVLEINTVYASKLIRAIRAKSGAMLRHDPKGRRWELLDRAKLERALAGAGGLAEYLHLVGTNSPELVDARADFLIPDPAVFATVRKACVERAALDVIYDSMTRPEGVARRIYPHSMVHLCRRWHVRAWCSERSEFRDFTLGRIREPRLISAGDAVPADRDWDTELSLEIVPHSGLSPAQADVIRREYFGGERGRTLICRAPLAPYLLQDLQVAVAPERETPPQFQLELANAGAVASHLFSEPQAGEHIHGTDT